MHKPRKASTFKKTIYVFCLLIAVAFVLPLFIMFVTKPQPDYYLTEADKKWLKTHGNRIEVLGYEAPPESYHDDEGEYVGFVVDFLHEVEQLLGTSFKIRHFAAWDDLLDYARSHRDFIIVGIAKTRDRQDYLSFTDAFVKIPYVVLVRKSNTHLTLSNLQQAQVCTIKGYAVNEYMEEFFPEITLRHVTDDVHGLRSLATDDCDAFVASQAHATFLAEQQGLANLRIIGEIGYLNRLGIAVARQDTLLHEILDKTVDQISPQRQREIYRRWVATDSSLSNSTKSALAATGMGVFALMACSWVWSLSLKTTVRNQTSQIQQDLETIQRAQEALREKSQELEQFFNATQDLLAIVDTDGHFHRLNEHWVQVFGYSLADLENRCFFDFLHPEDAPATREAFSTLKIRRESLNFTNRYRCRNGAYRWLEWYTTLAGRYVYAAARDITERKQAEAALQASETRFRDISAMASDWFWEQDDQFRFTFFSHGETMFGLNQVGIGPNQLLGKTRWELPISLTPEQWAAHRAVLEAYQPFRDFEYSIQAESGETHWFNVNGRPLFDATGRFIGYRGTGRDITARKQVEETLRQSRNLLQTVLDAIPVRVFWKDLNLRYLGCNRSFAMDAGVHSPADMLGKDDYQFTWREQADLYRGDDAAVLASNEPKIDYEEPQTTPDGRRIWLRTSKIPLRDADGIVFGVLGTCQDITERKRAEEALRESEAALNRAQVITHVGSWELDPVTGRLTGSDEVYRMFGLWPHEFPLTYETFIDVVHPDDRAVVDTAYSSSLRENRDIYEIEYRIIRRDSNEVRLVVERCEHIRNGAGEIVRSVGVVQDVTERKQTQAQRDLLNMAIEHALNGFDIVDEKLRFVYANPAYLRMWGYDSLEEIVGTSPIPHCADPAVPEQLAAILQTEGADVREFTARRKDGSTFEVLMATQRFRMPNGQVLFMGSSLDITERKRAEEELSRYRERLEELVVERTTELQRTNKELRQAMKQLVQTEKLAALGNLVAGVAHELNTPLGNARTVASALSEHLQEFANVVDSGALRRSQLEQFLSRSGEATQLLERNTARAADLISHFKQVAVDQTSMRRRRFNLRQTFEEMLATLKPQFKRTAHRITLDIPADLELDSYPGPLEQVFTNLISNSLLHGFVGMGAGVMRIQATPLDSARVQLVYTDNGVGIPASVLGRVFEPFFTTRLGSGGSGLGLYLTYNLVNSVLGGTIEVHSSVRQGVRFTLSLPTLAPHRLSLDTLV